MRVQIQTEEWQITKKKKDQKNVNWSRYPSNKTTVITFYDQFI